MLRADKHGLLVGCGNGSLLLREIQLEGKRRMSVREFLLGHPSDDLTAATSTDSDNAWREAVKGLPVIEEEMDETGVARFTRHTSITVKDLYQGLDKRRVLSRPSSTADPV